MDREITPNDYELLLQLDEVLAKPVASRGIVESLSSPCPEEAAGEMCSVCLHPFEPGEADGLRRLPCKHLFHEDCISKWLGQYCRCCPLCNARIEGNTAGDLKGDRERSVTGAGVSE